jgi:hypothetical protein
MSPIEAINYLQRLSGKMTGLTVAECRAYDNALTVIEAHLLPKPAKLVEAKLEEPKNPSQ